VERVAIFIDGSHFYHGLKNYIHRTDIDFEKLGEVLCAGRQLIRTYYYNAPVNRQDGEAKYRSQQKFFDKLNHVPYLTVKLGRLERRPGGLAEKGVDIKIAIDLLKLAYDDVYDVAILVSGDGDFAYAVNAVKDTGKHVEVAYFEAAKLYYLRQAADKSIPLDQSLLKSCFSSGAP
jgi:uncharacterized LabA/DUF88 family protein